MAFSVVELASGLWSVKLKCDIGRRIDNTGYCTVHDYYQKVTLVACSDNYSLLENICAQHNLPKFHLDNVFEPWPVIRYSRRRLRRPTRHSSPEREE